MSAHVLLNLLNKLLRKSDKMQGLLRILSLFRNKLIKFKNLMLEQECLLSYDIKITFWRENVRILPYIHNIVMAYARHFIMLP